MSRRRFRQLEVDPSTESAAREGPGAENDGAPVFRRSLELGGEPSADFAPREDRAPPPRVEPARESPPLAASAPEHGPASGNPESIFPANGSEAEPGFGAILAAGALTACIFALVSIPVRAAFASVPSGAAALRGSFELLAVVALTLVLRRLFARTLSTL